jgi:hypothetical protein
MLSQILTAVKQETGVICAETIAHRVGKEPQIVEAMLGELEAMGWIRSITNLAACDTCLAMSACGLSVSSSTRYVLSEDPQAHCDPQV